MAGSYARLSFHVEPNMVHRKARDVIEPPG